MSHSDNRRRVLRKLRPKPYLHPRHPLLIPAFNLHTPLETQRIYPPTTRLPHTYTPVFTPFGANIRIHSSKSPCGSPKRKSSDIRLNVSNAALRGTQHSPTTQCL